MRAVQYPFESRVLINFAMPFFKKSDKENIARDFFNNESRIICSLLKTRFIRFSET